MLYSILAAVIFVVPLTVMVWTARQEDTVWDDGETFETRPYGVHYK